MAIDPNEPIKPSDTNYAKAIKLGYQKEHEADGTLATAIIVSMFIVLLYVTAKLMGIEL